MSRSIFGWDLPPGCSMKDIEDQAGDRRPPCCGDCQEEECDQPEECERYQQAMKEEMIPE